MPSPAFVSNEISRACSSHEGLSTGQVVNSTLAADMYPAVASVTCSAEPRAGRFGRSKLALENASVSAVASPSAFSPRTVTSGAVNVTLPRASRLSLPTVAFSAVIVPPM